MSFRDLVKNNTTLLAVYLGNLFLSIHYYLIVYVNSSLLEKYFSDQILSILYIVASLINLFLFLFAPRILRKLGTYRFLLYAAIVEGLAVLGLAFAGSAVSVGFFFALHQSLVVMVLLGLDIFLESSIKEESHTGRWRSMYLTIANIMLVIAPAIVGTLVVDDNYSPVYILSALIIIPLLLVVTGIFSGVRTPEPRRVEIKDSIGEIWADKNIRAATGSYFILQTFYSWMIVYTPIYLHQYIGFGWETLGILFTIMLLPFVLFEIPVGELADERFGEKEFLIFGYFVMAISTMLFLWIDTASFAIWAAVLFLSRVGASFVEVTTESYFFKHVDGQNGNTIAFFRSGRSIGFIVAPIVAGVLLVFLPFRVTFLALSLISAFGMYVVWDIKDSK